MLHILVLILKIIGIVLLVLLGLLLVVLLLVLLVPLRYRLSGSWHGGPSGWVRITWLLHAVSVRADYDDGLKVTAKLLGFRILETGADVATDGDVADAGADDADGAASSPAEDAIEDADGERDAAENVEGAADGTDAEAHSSAPDAAEPSPAENAVETSPESPSPAEDGIDVEQFPTIEEQLRLDEEQLRLDEEQLCQDEEQLRQDEDSGYGGTVAEETAEGGLADEGDACDVIEKIEDLFSKISGKLQLADQKRLWIQHFMEDPKNQKTLRLIWRQVKAMIVHILPRKAAGQITIGFDDPATTGQVLAACSVIYALYGTALKITPDFGQAVIDGDLQMKGYVRLGTLAAMTVRILVDRNLFRMIKKVRKFLESGGK